MVGLIMENRDLDLSEQVSAPGESKGGFGDSGDWFRSTFHYIQFLFKKKSSLRGHKCDLPEIET